MYLRYKRDGSMLDHNVHVFAFVTDDFRRLQLTSLRGYGKPVLKLHHGELATDNVPVPRRSRVVRFLALKPNPLREFRSVAVLVSLVERVWLPRGSVISEWSHGRPTPDYRKDDRRSSDDRKPEEQRSGAGFPAQEIRLRAKPKSLAWRTWIRAESAKRSIPFIDLFDDFQRLPTTTREGMFICSDSLQNFPETPGHYDDQGHAYVAKQVYAKLISIPEIAAKLGRFSRPPAAAKGGGSNSPGADGCGPSK